jgi:hypothetical protein
VIFSSITIRTPLSSKINNREISLHHRFVYINLTLSFIAITLFLNIFFLDSYYWTTQLHNHDNLICIVYEEPVRPITFSNCLRINTDQLLVNVWNYFLYNCWLTILNRFSQFTIKIHICCNSIGQTYFQTVFIRYELQFVRNLFMYRLEFKSTYLHNWIGNVRHTRETNLIL